MCLATAVGLEKGSVPGKRWPPGTLISRRWEEGAFGEAEGPGTEGLGFLGQGWGGRKCNRQVGRWWTRPVAGRFCLLALECALSRCCYF